MKAHDINPFVESLDNVLTTMLNIKPRRLPVKLSNGDGRDAALTSLIGISGRMHGVVVLRFPQQTAVRFAGLLLGSEYRTLTAEVTDAIAEICNMVAGAAKARFHTDPPLELGLPTVVEGVDYRVRYPSRAAWIEVPYDTDAGRFSMELTFESN